MKILSNKEDSINISEEIEKYKSSSVILKSELEYDREDN